MESEVSKLSTYLDIYHDGDIFGVYGTDTIDINLFKLKIASNRVEMILAASGEQGNIIMRTKPLKGGTVPDFVFVFPSIWSSYLIRAQELEYPFELTLKGHALDLLEIKSLEKRTNDVYQAYVAGTRGQNIKKFMQKRVEEEISRKRISAFNKHRTALQPIPFQFNTTLKQMLKEEIINKWLEAARQYVQSGVRPDEIPVDCKACWLERKALLQQYRQKFTEARQDIKEPKRISRDTLAEVEKDLTSARAPQKTMDSFTQLARQELKGRERYAELVRWLANHEKGLSKFFPSEKRIKDLMLTQLDNREKAAAGSALQKLELFRQKIKTKKGQLLDPILKISRSVSDTIRRYLDETISLAVLIDTIKRQVKELATSAWAESIRLGAKEGFDVGASILLVGIPILIVAVIFAMLLPIIGVPFLITAAGAIFGGSVLLSPLVGGYHFTLSLIQSREIRAQVIELLDDLLEVVVARETGYRLEHELGITRQDKRFKKSDLKKLSDKRAKKAVQPVGVGV